MYPINVKMADPMGSKFSFGTHMTSGKVNGCTEFQKVLILVNLKNSRK